MALHQTSANAPTRYDLFGQTLHWLTAVLVLAAFILGPGGPEVRVYSAARDFERSLHETLGVTVLALTLIRLVWRSRAALPLHTGIPAWMVAASEFMRWTLYVLLFAVPLTAIAGAWLEGHPLTLLAGLQVPPPFTSAHGVGNVLAEVHGWLGDAILWLAGFHAAAALVHHFLLRDGVLLAMLPGARRPRA